MPTAESDVGFRIDVDAVGLGHLLGHQASRGDGDRIGIDVGRALALTSGIDGGIDFLSSRQHGGVARVLHLGFGEHHAAGIDRQGHEGKDGDQGKTREHDDDAPSLSRVWLRLSLIGSGVFHGAYSGSRAGRRLADRSRFIATGWLDRYGK